MKRFQPAASSLTRSQGAHRWAIILRKIFFGKHRAEMFALSHFQPPAGFWMLREDELVLARSQRQKGL